MVGDYELALTMGRCERCSGVVAASFRELQSTGIFLCSCGAATRAFPTASARTPFSYEGWQDANDAYPASNRSD
jgi:hypothetical protein